MSKDFINPFGANNTFGKAAAPVVIPASASAPTQKIQPEWVTDMLDYIDKMDGDFYMAEFSYYWRSLKNADLQASQYSKILRQLSSKYGRRATWPNIKLGHWLRENLYDWEGGVTRTIDKADATGISINLTQSSRLGFVLSPALMDIQEAHLRKILSGKSVDGLNRLDRSISHALSGWSIAAYIPAPETLQIIRACIRTGIEYFSQKDVTHNLRDLAVIHCLAPENSEVRTLCREIATDFMGVFNLQKADVPKLSQYRDAAVWFDFDVPLPIIPARPNTVSNRERELGRFLPQGLRATFKRTDPQLPALQKQCDYSFESTNGQRLYMEYDGDRHFLLHADNTLQYDGPTIFQSRLTNKSHPEGVVLRMPWMLFGEIIKLTPSPDDRRAFMANIVEAGLAQPTGISLVLQRGTSNTDFTFAPL